MENAPCQAENIYKNHQNYRNCFGHRLLNIYGPYILYIRLKENKMAFLFGFIFTLVIAAVVLLIVDRLNPGLSLDGFGSAIIAALVIAIVSSVLVWLVGLLGITLGATGLL